MSDSDLSHSLQHYVLHHTLGTGGFAKVKSATHRLTGEKVAVKIMDKKALGEDLRRVNSEITALKDLAHQNICRLFEVIQTSSHYYLILEYCSGGELFDYIVRKDKLAESEARHFFRQILSAIAYVHNRGYAHRDLKPENLLLSSDLQLKLIDFGLCAKPSGGLMGSPLETCCGSPAYAAPELISGQNYLGSEADIWSLGVLLYALLCGFLPFEDDNLSAMYRKVCSGKYDVPEWLSVESKEILYRMLQVNPKHRISVEDLLKHPWVMQGYTMPVKWQSIYSSCAFDEHCITVLAEYYDLPQKSLKNLLLKNDYNELTASYYLLLQRKRTAQPIRLIELKVPKSPAEVLLSSPTFHASLEKDLDQIYDLVGTKDANNSYLQAINTPYKPPRAPLTPQLTRKVPSIPELAFTPQMPRKLVNIENFTTPAPTSTPFSTALMAEQSSDDSPRTPRSRQKMAGQTTRTPRNVFHSLERGFDKVLKAVTPKRRNLEPPVAKTISNVSTTSTKDATAVLTELLRVFREQGMECTQQGWIIRGKKKDAMKRTRLTLELQVVRVAQFDNVIGVRRKRLQGDAFLYKRVCENVLQLANL